MVGATMTKAQQPSLTASSNRTINLLPGQLSHRGGDDHGDVAPSMGHIPMIISKTWMAHIDAAARM
jgi:hypothetical protein